MKPNALRKLSLSLLLAIGGLLASFPCRAQAFYLWQGSLESEGRAVAHIRRVRVSASFETATEVAVVFEDDALSVEGNASIVETDASPWPSHLAVGVGERARLRSARGWRIEMLPETWAPVLGGGEHRIRIALPDDFPVPTATLETSVEPAVEDPFDEPWSWDPELEVELARRDRETRVVEDSCSGQRLRPRPGARASWRMEWLPWETVRGLSRGGLWARVRGYLKGFAISGVRRRIPCESVVFGRDFRIGNGPCRVGHADGCDPGGRRIWLEPGTAVYASPQSSEPFALIKRRILATERAPITAIMPCLRCAIHGETAALPRPVDPSLPPVGELAIEHQRGESTVRLTGYLKVAAASLVEIERLPCRLVGSYGSSWGNWPER